MLLKDENNSGVWLKGKTIDGKYYKTVSYGMWCSMVSRCKKDGASSYKRKSYENCNISEEFKDFQKFASWHVGQAGYGLGYELDKDLLGDGKLYASNTCTLLPHALNAFLKDTASKDNGLPAGVTISTTRRGTVRFRSVIQSAGKLKHLGYFTTAALAHSCYIQAKREEVVKWHERAKSAEFVFDAKTLAAILRK